MLGKIEGRGEEGIRGWDGWMVSPMQWTWTWTNAGGWWGTGRPGMLQSIESQKVGHGWANEQQQQHGNGSSNSCHKYLSCVWHCYKPIACVISPVKQLLLLPSIFSGGYEAPTASNNLLKVKPGFGSRQTFSSSCSLNRNANFWVIWLLD